MSKVYVPSDRDYDFTSAKQYGELVVITEGSVNIFNLKEIRAIIKEKMKQAKEDDYVVMVGAPVINALIVVHMMLRFGRVNFLLYNAKACTYDVRTVTEGEAL